VSNATAAYSDLVIALVMLVSTLEQFFGFLVIAMQAGQNDNADTKRLVATIKLMIKLLLLISHCSIPTMA